MIGNHKGIMALFGALGAFGLLKAYLDTGLDRVVDVFAVTMCLVMVGLMEWDRNQQAKYDKKNNDPLGIRDEDSK